MKILHIAESIRGGCGTYLNEVLPLQAGALGSDQVRCLVPQQHAAHLIDVAPATIRTFERRERRSGLRYLAAGIWSCVRDWQPDIIHAHSTFAGGLVRLLSTAWQLPPIVYCPHGWVFDVELARGLRGATRAAERLLALRAARIVAISDAERRQGERAGIDPRKLVVVPNGINATYPQESADWHDPRLKLLFVGRLDRQKGVDVLLAAVANLAASVSVRIIGEEVLTAPADVQGTAPAHVEFLGWRGKAEVSAHLNACDLVVMPSRWEGFGLVAIEAMRAGKPVVASSVGGLLEIVVDGITGRIVAPDDPAALAAALTRLSRATLQRMGAAGRERFLQRYTSDRTHAGLMQVYRDVLPARAPLRPSAIAARRRGVVE